MWPLGVYVWQIRIGLKKNWSTYSDFMQIFADFTWIFELSTSCNWASQYYIQCGPSMTSWVDPHPFIESIHTLRFESIHTLLSRSTPFWEEGCGSNQDIIDGPHCTNTWIFGYLDIWIPIDKLPNISIIKNMLLHFGKLWLIMFIFKVFKSICICTWIPMDKLSHTT